MTHIFTELVFYICLLLAGCLVFLIGQLIIGWRREGGCRLVLLFIGALATILGAGMIRALQIDSISLEHSILFVLVAVVFCLLGLLLVVVSIAASNERVRKWMDEILNRLP